MSEIISRIKRLLSDESVIPMYLMTGDWGSGKTYFIKNTLIEEIKSEGKNIKYLSAYGVESLSDFRDKYLSVFITGEDSSVSFGGSALETALSISSEIDSKASGIFSSLVKGFGGVAKKIAINNLPKTVVVIDDIERIKDKNLISKILGELLSFADAGKADVIVVSNTAKLGGNNDDVEKVFSEVITFKLGFNEALDIAFSNSNLEPEELDSIIKLSELLSATNLRVSIKAARRFNEVIQAISGLSGINNSLSRTILLRTIFIICHAHYSFSLDNVRIIEVFDNYDDTGLNDNEKTIHSIVRNNLRTPPDELISYCCGLGCAVDEINFIEYLPKESNLEDYLTSWQDCFLSDSAYIEAISIAKKYLFDDGVKNPVKWLRLAEYIYYKGVKGYFEIPGGTVDKYIERLHCIVDGGSFERIERISEISISSSFSDKIKPVFESLIIKLNKDCENERISILKKKMRNSFSSVSSELARDLSAEPVFKEIGAEFIFECLKVWDYSDLFSIQPFISGRYRPANIMDFLSDEIQFLDELHTLVDNYKETLENGRRKGYFNDISDLLKGVVERFKPKGNSK